MSTKPADAPDAMRDDASAVVQKYAPTVPNFMRLGSVPVNYLQEIETDLLEPVIFNDGAGSSVDGFIRFQLQNKGFLHSHSKIFLSVKPHSTTGRAIYPPNVGVGKLIKKAVLKIGNKVLNEISDWDKLHAFHSTKISNENMKERELYTTGRCLNFAVNRANGGAIGCPAKGLSMEVGRDPDLTIQADLTTTDLDNLQMPFAVLEGAAQAEAPSYAVDLSDLFPFLKVHQLPLFTMIEPVTIELTLYPPTNHRLVHTGTGGTDVTQVLDQNEVKFCADYIYYGSGDEMESWANQNKQLDFSFVDYRSITTTVSNTSIQSDTVRNIGMASRLVSKVITMFGRSADDTGEDDLLMDTAAMSTVLDGTKKITGPIEYNLRYNDKFEFSSNVSNTARLYTLLQQAEGIVFINRSAYSSQGNAFAAAATQTNTFEGKTLSDDIQGEFFFLCTRLSGGRVGQRGIELHVKAADGLKHTDVSIMRNYCEYMRSARLENGVISVFNL